MAQATFSWLRLCGGVKGGSHTDDIITGHTGLCVHSGRGCVLSAIVTYS